MPAPDNRHPVLGAAARGADDLAVDLRRAFERVLFERYGQVPAQDPVVSALFHATATQLARVYDEAEQVFPEAVFDDLVSGLGMPPRAAQAAQAVLGFSGVARPELIDTDVAFTGTSRQGAHLPFTVDVPVRLAPTQLAFAGVVEQGRLTTLPGATIPAPDGAEAGAGMPVGSHTVALDDPYGVAAPTLFLAFEAGDGHLSGLSLFVETPTADHPVTRALGRSAWQLLEGDGVTHAELVLRSRPGPGGVRALHWLRAVDPRDRRAYGPAYDPRGRRGEDGMPNGTAPAPPGPYGAMCTVWPEVPPARRLRSQTPATLAGALARVLTLDELEAYERPLVWVQVALPADVRGVGNAVQRVLVNAAAVSNVEAFAETVSLDKLGSVVKFRPEGSRTRHLVHVLGVTGEQGVPYVAEEVQASVPLSHGRYRVRGAELEVRAARGPTGRFDRYVQARFAYSDGAGGNGLDVGTEFRPSDELANAEARAGGLVISRGGAAPPRYGGAKVRFAELLRTRERVVTVADVEAAARAFDARVRRTTAETVAEVGDDGVPRAVQRVRAFVRPAEFSDPASELPQLADALERHLQARTTLGSTMRVVVEADPGA